MTSTRKRISIHDYPEHLNPFSESHMTIQDRRKIFVDKLRKNGTWSSKISKRLSRSVSWLEKPWVATEESPKKTDCESRICTKIHETTYSSPTQINGLSRTESCFDVSVEENKAGLSLERQRTQQTSCVQSEDKVPTPEDSQSHSKPQIKKRKKRPAPRPPSSVSNCSPTTKVAPESISNQIGLEQEKQCDRVTVNVENGSERNTNEEQPCSLDKEITKTCTPISSIQTSFEEPSTTTETPVNDLQNLKINDQPSSSNQSSLEESPDTEHKMRDLEINDHCEEPEQCGVNDTNTTNTICKDVMDEESDAEVPDPKRESPLLDENANIKRSPKSEEKKPSLLKVHCNGKAVMV